MSFSEIWGLRGEGYGLGVRGYGGKMNASEQITAARMPQKGTTLRGKMNAGETLAGSSASTKRMTERTRQDTQLITKHRCANSAANMRQKGKM